MRVKPLPVVISGPPFDSAGKMGSMSAGKKIRTLRKAQGLNQGELARLAGIKQSTLSDLERGDSNLPRGDTLVKIAAALKVDPESLMNREPGGQLRQVDVDESDLVSMYRALSEQNRGALIATAKALLGSQPEPPEPRRQVNPKPRRPLN